MVAAAVAVVHHLDGGDITAGPHGQQVRLRPVQPHPESVRPRVEPLCRAGHPPPGKVGHLDVHAVGIRQCHREVGHPVERVRHILRDGESGRGFMVRQPDPRHDEDGVRIVECVGPTLRKVLHHNVM